MPYSKEMLPHLVGPRTDQPLEHSTALTRIIDFFSAADLITSRRLYIPLAKKFQDPNEGVEASIDLQSIVSGPCAGVVFPANPDSNFFDVQRNQLLSNYVSCWTMERESVAMWSLYSPDKSSIQIETTYQSLLEALTTLAIERHDPNTFDVDSEEICVLISRIGLLPVRYITLESLLKRIDRRRKAYDHLDSLGRIQEKKGTDWLRGNRDMQRANEYKYSPFSLKDSSFSHEREVRAIITAGCFDNAILRAAIESDQSYSIILNDTADACKRDGALLGICHKIQELSDKKGLGLPDSFKLEVGTDFIKSVTIDPRCPPHKEAFMRDFFTNQGITIRESRCFGHAAKGASLIPRRNIGKKQQ